MKTSQCGAIMHEARNALQAIMGIALDIDEAQAKQINQEAQRISAAIKNCDKVKECCGNCENKVGVRL